MHVQPSYECCQVCGLWQGASHWKINPITERSRAWGKKENSEFPLLILDHFPSREDDKHGRPFTGEVERFMRGFLDYFEFNWIYDNTVRCHSMGKPSPKQRTACGFFTEKRISDNPPEVILCLGIDPCKNLVGAAAPKTIASARVAPIQHEGVWVITTYHPLNHVMEPRRMDLTEEYQRVFLLVEQILKGEYNHDEVRKPA